MIWVRCNYACPLTDLRVSTYQRWCWSCSLILWALSFHFWHDFALGNRRESVCRRLMTAEKQCGSGVFIPFTPILPHTIHPHSPHIVLHLFYLLLVSLFVCFVLLPLSDSLIFTNLFFQHLTTLFAGYPFIGSCKLHFCLSSTHYQFYWALNHRGHFSILYHVRYYFQSLSYSKPRTFDSMPCWSWRLSLFIRTSLGKFCFKQNIIATGTVIWRSHVCFRFDSKLGLYTKLYRNYIDLQTKSKII